MYKPYSQTNRYHKVKNWTIDYNIVNSLIVPTYRYSFSRENKKQNQRPCHTDSNVPYNTLPNKSLS